MHFAHFGHFHTAPGQRLEQGAGPLERRLLPELEPLVQLELVQLEQLVPQPG